jgi:hypothetical protein
VKHKIKIKSSSLDLWYVKCLGCKWFPDWLVYSEKHGYRVYGRDTWDAAFALGVAHQKNAELEERLKL